MANHEPADPIKAQTISDTITDCSIEVHAELNRGSPHTSRNIQLRQVCPAGIFLQFPSSFDPLNCCYSGATIGKRLTIFAQSHLVGFACFSVYSTLVQLEFYPVDHTQFQTILILTIQY